MRTQYRLGVDAGGTFTDFVIADDKGTVRLFKTPSTPQNPTAAIGGVGAGRGTGDEGRGIAEGEAVTAA